MIKILPDAKGRMMITAPIPVQFSWTYMSGLLDVVQGDDCPESMAYLREPSNIAILKEQVATLRDRADHALKRLKSKGYYVTDTDSVYDKLMNDFNDVTEARARLYVLSLNRKNDHVPYVDSITDDQWYAAIEQTMYQRHFDLYINTDGMFTPALWDCIPDLYLNLLSVVYGHALLDMHQKLQVQQAAIEPIVNDCQKLTKETERIIRERDELLATVERQKAVIEEYRAADAKTGHAKDKEILALRRRIRELESAHAEPDETKDPEPAPVLTEPESGPEEPERILHDLPEKDVIFVGGDWNLQKRLKALYPEWYLIGTDDRNFPAKTGIKAIFIWSTQMGHATMARLNRMYDTSVPRLYATKTNMDSLVQEMTDVWSDWMEKNQGTND